MKRFFCFLILLLLAAAGLGYLLFPVLSDQYGQYQKEKTIAEYQSRVSSLSAEKREELLTQAERYSGAMNRITVTDVFSDASRPLPAEPDVIGESAEEETPEPIPDYQDQLRVSGGVMGVLEIPGLHIRLPFYGSGSGKQADRELMHMEGTSLPVGGAGTHAVLTGPGLLPAPEGILRDIGLTSEKMLEEIGGMAAGDLFIVRTLDRTLVYQVSRVWSVSANALDELALEPGGDIMTLRTPQKEQRLLVQGKRVEIRDAEQRLDAEETAAVPPDWLNIVIFGAPVLLLGILVTAAIEIIKRPSYRLPGEKRGKKINSND